MGAYEFTGIVTGISKSLPTDFVVTAYPNPFSEVVYFVINRALVTGDKLTFNLSDINGKLISSGTIPLNASGNTIYKMERGSLVAGIYLYKLENESGTVSVGKLVVVD